MVVKNKVRKNIKNKMRKVRLFIIPTLAILVLAVFVVASALFYNMVQEELRTTESSVVAKAISLNLVNEIKNLTRILNDLNQIEVINTENKIQIYDKVSKNLIEKYESVFYGISFINPEGIIEKIYPLEKNQLALGKNLLENPYVKSYLENSRDKKTTHLSHRILTYQGIYAMVVYEPLFDKERHFKGWFSAVINVDAWLKSEMQTEGWQDLFIRLNWKNQIENNLEIGVNDSIQLFTYNFKILNQNLEINIGLPESRLKSLHTKLLYTLNVLGFVLLLLVSYFLYKLTISQYKLIIAKQQLNLKSILLNSLAHDLSSPLTSLNLVMELASLKKETAFGDASLLQKAQKNLRILNEMLVSVRSLSRLEKEKEELKTQSVPLNEAVQNAIELVQDQALIKKVDFRIDSIQRDIFIQADKVTLVNNVIPNVLSNAIKFTEENSTVIISVEQVIGYVDLCIKNQGRHFSENTIRNFNEGQVTQSNLGTAGEVGSGLGLIQVKSFMELYGGFALIMNSDKGVVVKLRFKEKSS